MKLTPRITLVPILHGKAAFSTHVRNLCNAGKFDCIAIDIQQCFGAALHECVHELPLISAAVALHPGHDDAPVYYIPADPCDAAIEAIRQAQQKRIPCIPIGYPELYAPPPLPPLPDAYAITTMGFEEYCALCMHGLSVLKTDARTEKTAQYAASRLRELELRYSSILALVHFRRVTAVVSHFAKEHSYNLSFSITKEYSIEKFPINPDHLYFALGELPFVTGLHEKERMDLFAGPVAVLDTIKDLFCHTRDHYFDRTEDAMELSPVRIQTALTFLRNLTLMENRFIPSLFDIIAAAKGIGGNAFAVRILKSAKYYPFLPLGQEARFLSVGIDRILRPGLHMADHAVNLFRDTAVEWKTISIKPDPSDMRRKKYRYLWNPLGMCSHVPEDRYIENFNTHVRSKSLRILCEDSVKTEKFMTSVRDGIDIRETLCNWYTGDIYVREIPPSRGAVDTVVIIFDDSRDDRYPQQTTWYAEHDEESTLTFYSTDPFDDIIGPGIARCTYGGLSLLFPPRHIPNVFDLPETAAMKKSSYKLAYGALLFTNERSIAYVADAKPDVFLRQLASKMRKHIIWIPLGSFSSETIRKLRTFHILNGKQVRSWASRFIGE